MSFAITSAVIGVIGLGVSGYGAVEASNAQKQQGKSTKQWDLYNAQVQQQQAAAVLNQSQQAAEKKRVEGDAVVARQRVLYASSGLEISGTPTELMIGTAGDIEEDAQAIQNKGLIEYQQQMEGAQLSIGQGNQAEIAGNLQSQGTLLSGIGSGLSQGSNMASKYYQPGNSGNKGNIPTASDALSISGFDVN